MSLVLPVLYHWSPARRRPGIRRRGLTPHTVTCVFDVVDVELTEIGERFADGSVAAHAVRTLEVAEHRAVALGTSASHAWSLSGQISATPGAEWDLWQVTLDDDDRVVPHEFTGYRLDEFRVLNRIPADRCWLVATRTCNSRRPF